MTKITREIHINAPRQEVWDKTLADFGNIFEWNPNVPKSYSTNDISGGSGATRHCDLGGKASIEERVTEWREGKSLQVLITEGKGMPPFKTMPIARFDLKDEKGGTRVRMSLEYQLGMGPIGAVMDAMMAKRQFTGNVESLLAGQKHFVEKGKKGSGAQLNTSLVSVVAT